MTLDEIISSFASLSLDAIHIGYREPGEEWARHLWGNESFFKLFGFTQEDVQGQRVELVFDPDHLVELVGQVRPAVRRGDETVQVESWARRKDGTRFRANTQIIFFPEDEKGGRFSVGIFRDVTETRNRDRAAQQALVEREALATEVLELQDRLMAAIDTLPGPLAIWDKDFRLVVCNAAFAPRILGQPDPPKKGISVEEVLKQAAANGHFEEAIGREEQFALQSIAAVRSGKISDTTAYTDGRIFKAESTMAENGDMLILATDITDLIEQEKTLEEYASKLEAINKEMEFKAFHDDLTGLRNRRFLSQELDALNPSDQCDAANVAVLQIDLDRFKQINDTLGHAAGDYVLVEVAKRLRSCVRDGDLVARLGGDEFVVIVRFSELEVVQSLAERLVEELSKNMEFEDNEIRVGASVGVAHTPISEPSSLLTNADIALYRAKNTGRNRCWFFAQEDRDALIAQKALADDILRGLDADEFEPFFQPQVDARSGTLVGLEVLVRWNHPRRGVLTPNDFLSTVEDLGQLGEVDQRMFRKAFDFMAGSQFKGPAPGVSFNVSYTSLMNDALLSFAKEAGAAPFPVALELLETIYLEEEADALLLRLDALRDAGVSIEVDDFGSGRASIVALQQIAPERMKIDGRLISPILASAASRGLVSSIVNIGHTLGIGVTAEGVETEKHAEILRDVGCDRLQGFFFSKPVPFSDIEATYCKPASVRPKSKRG